MPATGCRQPAAQRDGIVEMEPERSIRDTGSIEPHPAARRLFPVGRPLRLLAGLALLSAMSVSTAEPDGRFSVVAGWPDGGPDAALGQATGVGVDSRNRVWVFHRADRIWREPFPAEPITRPTIAVFDGDSGRLLKTLGGGRFVMPHGLTIDSEDNVWITDVALHQVFKFDPEGKLLLSLGEARRSGNDNAHFNRPTDVAVLSDGSFYVADGYGNSRVMKFSREGVFAYSWGKKGTAPGEFDTPHAIAVDAAGRVHVADRGNRRVQLFDARGRFLAEWTDSRLGRPYSLALSPRYGIVVDGGDQTGCAYRERSQAAIVGDGGTVLGSFGRYGSGMGQFRMAHDVALARDGAAYIVEAEGRRIQKFIRR